MIYSPKMQKALLSPVAENNEIPRIIKLCVLQSESTNNGGSWFEAGRAAVE